MLTNDQIRDLPKTGKAYKKGDARGVYVYVSHIGTKSLRWKYRYHRRERVLTLGMHPYVQIEQARTRAELAREYLNQDLDPMDRLPAVRGRPLVTLADLDGMPAPLSAESVVYFAQIATGHIKIGVTTRIAQRIRSFQHSHAEPVVLLATMVGGHAHEQLIHKVFAGDRDNGEWFSPSADLLDFIAKVKGLACR